MTVVQIKSKNESIIYKDTEDHFQNAFLRLMSMERETFDKWLELSSNIESDLSFKLFHGFKKLFPINDKIKSTIVDAGPNEEVGVVLHPTIAENNDYGIAWSSESGMGWLIKYNSVKNEYERVIQPPIYEESYFEGNELASGGYSDYAAQADWRLEKSARQVTELSNVTGLQNGKILDLGSGYGYFRKALDDAGFEHEGVEISKHANEIAKNLYGFDSHQGLLIDHLHNFQEKFDAVVLGDVIEHTSNPIELLKEIYSVLKPGGFVVIKTPNLDCPEASLFGAYYHSFKREHLVYFTNKSLLSYAVEAGLIPHKSLSASHLLVGFVGEEKTNKWAKDLNGSDLIIYLKKPN